MMNPSCGPTPTTWDWKQPQSWVATAAPAIGFVDVADETDLKLLSQELRRPPIEMHVDAVLILGRLIGEIVGEAEHAREFVPGLRVEIGVATAGVDSAVPDADVRQSCRVVSPDRHIPHHVGHDVVN